MRGLHFVFGTACALGIAFLPDAAHAFCRTTTIPAPPNFDSTAGCFAQGIPLYHPSQCVAYRLRTVESPLVPNAVLSNSLGRAFGAWTAANTRCLPGIDAIELEPTSETAIVGYKQGQRGHNIVGFVDGPWPHGNALSLSTLTFKPDTGEVYDVDMELTSEVPWSFGSVPPADGYDLDAVITHEVGHFLGLAHGPVAESSMFAAYMPGSTSQRTLAPDDEAGICTTYPNRQTRFTLGIVPSTVCSLSPTTPDAGSSCGADPNVTHGCAVSSGEDTRWHTGWWLGLVAVAMAGARRGRRARAT